MILYIIINVICLQAIVESRAWVVLYKLQNAVIAGLGPKGMRDRITWLVWNALSCICFCDTDCFGIAPARRPCWIKHRNRIEVISFECVRTKSKLNRSAGVWQKTLCDHKNALPLMSLRFVTLGCWNFWWQLAVSYGQGTVQFLKDKISNVIYTLSDTHRGHEAAG